MNRRDLLKAGLLVPFCSTKYLQEAISGGEMSIAPIDKVHEKLAETLKASDEWVQEMPITASLILKDFCSMIPVQHKFSYIAKSLIINGYIITLKVNLSNEYQYYEIDLDIVNGIADFKVRLTSCSCRQIKYLGNHVNSVIPHLKVFNYGPHLYIDMYEPNHRMNGSYTVFNDAVLVAYSCSVDSPTEQEYRCVYSYPY